MTPDGRLHVAIVGGGAAGALSALNLVGLPAVGRITLFDRDGSFGRGLAYSATEVWHRINVPAYKMGGCRDDDPDGFINWLAANNHPTGPDYSRAFVARRIYGDYLTSCLTAAQTRGEVELRAASVDSIEHLGAAYRLRTGGGNTIDADVVLLCPGNPPPSPLVAFGTSYRSISNVWAPGALQPIGRNDDVLVIGTAATAVDMVVDLFHRGVGRHVVLLSRRGLLPREDVELPQDDPVPFEFGATPTVATLLSTFRQTLRGQAAAGVPWQAVIDGFRLHTRALWEALPAIERNRFTRHLRSIWLVHRHRLAPDVAQLLSRLQQEGRLRVVAGRTLRAEQTAGGFDVTVRRRGGGTEQLSPNWILNCTGPEERYNRLIDPLIGSLLASGQARPGPAGIGLDVSPDCLLRDINGKPQSGLYLIGPATRGSFWEVTAATNIRQQAIAVAGHLQSSAAKAAGSNSVPNYDPAS